MKSSFQKIEALCAERRYAEAVLLCLSSAEAGVTEAQNKLCQIFFDYPEVADQMPDIFWEKISDMAQGDDGFANFIMHCRYFTDPSQSHLAYDYIRKAVRNNQIPQAFLRLGIMYDKGIGTASNQTLANYFFEKAHSMGSPEADRYIFQAYDEGKRDVVHTVENTLERPNRPSFATLTRLRKLVEREREKKNYGTLSKLRPHISMLFPDYDAEDAISDILEGKDTPNADIYYSLSTSDNYSEVDVKQQDQVLEEMFAPVLKDSRLLRRLWKTEERSLLTEAEFSVMRSSTSFSNTYVNNCMNFWVQRKDVPAIGPDQMLPYIAPSTLAAMRRKAVGCLLSMRGSHSLVEVEFLKNLDNDNALLDVCEKIRDEQLRLFLVSFIELNVDINILQQRYYSFLEAYRKKDQRPLVSYFRDFVQRMAEYGIDF